MNVNRFIRYLFFNAKITKLYVKTYINAGKSFLQHSDDNSKGYVHR